MWNIHLFCSSLIVTATGLRWAIIDPGYVKIRVKEKLSQINLRQCIYYNRVSIARFAYAYKPPLYYVNAGFYCNW